MKDLGEFDRFITLYTAERGKITCLAKGIRKISSKRGSHAEILNAVEVQLWKSRHHYYLTACKNDVAFSTIKTEMAGLASAFFMIELLDRLTMEEHPLPGIFELLEKTLSLMEFSPEDHVFLREVFLLKLLKELGYMTSFRSCSRCQKKLPLEEAYIDKKESQVFCKNCKGKKSFQREIEILPLEDLKLMNFILEQPTASLLRLNTQNNHLETIAYWGRVFLYKNLAQPLKSESALNLYQSMRLTPSGF